MNMMQASASVGISGALLLTIAVTSGLSAGDVRTQLEPLGGAVPDASQERGCGDLLLNADGTYEMPYSWQYGGVVPPDFGAFAECYEGASEVCSATFDLVQLGHQIGQTMDVYVWDDAGGEPGAVLCAKFGVDPGPIAFWPSVSRHEIELDGGCCTGAAWWIGYWPDWPSAGAAWFLAGDLDGWVGGCPLTRIAPGIGYPTGWANVSVVWGPTQAMGIGARVRPCEPTPTSGASWGSIKTLFD